MLRLPRIPDILTTANLSCGVASILLASQGQLTLACWLVFAGAAFDVLDGLAARALGGGSELGKQLDSLADMVTFGVAPGMLIFCLPLTNSDLNGSLHLFTEMNFQTHMDNGSNPFDLSRHWAQWVAAICVPCASAWRLAKFNIDTRQATGFLGLPTPANALFWASIVLSLHPETMSIRIIRIPCTGALLLLLEPLVLMGLSLVLGILMLSEIPLPSLKFKHFNWRGNEVILTLFSIGLVLLALYGILAVPLILLLYLLSPLWGKLFPKQPT